MDDIKKTVNAAESGSEEPNRFLRELPTRMTTITLDIPLRDALKRLRQNNETYSDVIRRLIGESTKSLGNENISAVLYVRKIVFLQTAYRYKNFGIEIEYNDVKTEQSGFTLDLKIKKVFFGKQVLNPTIFFGLDDAHKHYSPAFLNLYLKGVAFVLKKEFKVMTDMYVDKDFEDIALWRSLYYNYSLSEDSFKQDIESPLRLSEEEKIPIPYLEKMNSSVFKRMAS